MATTTIKTPSIIKIENTSTATRTFAPYRENFNANLAVGITIEFSTENAGQVLYYLAQAAEGLEVTQINAFDTASASILAIETPATITITNTSTAIRTFFPYRENFTVDVEAGDVVELVASNVGQVLYYLAQATEGLEITQTKITVS